MSNHETEPPGRAPDARQLLLPLLIAALLSTIAVTSAADAALAETTDVPTLEALPTTATSQPYGSDDTGVDDLASLGYVQEEYLMSGEVDGLPYTTRILVRRPAKPAHFSGVVIAESIRSTGSRSMWALRDYITRSGHAYVEIGSNHQAINGLVKPSDPDRYAELEMPAPAGTLFGHVLELISQGGVAIDAGTPGGPFDGFDVDHVLLAGCSEQGLVIRLYMRDAHPVYRDAAGESVFDGYFPSCVADWPEPFIIVDGAPLQNFTPGPIEVPVINLASQTEVDSFNEYGQRFRRPDADGPDDFYRVYEVAGQTHGTTPSPVSGCTGQPTTPVPGDDLAAAAMDNLVRWVADGVAPPHGEPLATDPSTGRVLTDADGIAIGGIHSAVTAVPTGRWSSCLLLVYDSPYLAEPFSTTELAARYRTPGRYVAAVNRHVADLVRDGWYLATDARDVRAGAVETAQSWREGGWTGPGRCC